MDRDRSRDAREALLGFLRERRKAIDPPLSRAQVARLAGISSQWYAMIESGRARRVSESTISAIGVTLRLTDEDRALFRALLEAVRNAKGTG